MAGIIFTPAGGARELTSQVNPHTQITAYFVRFRAKKNTPCINTPCNIESIIFKNETRSIENLAREHLKSVILIQVEILR